MVNPTKDIAIASILGLAAATMWNTWKNSDLKQINDYYKWAEKQPKKAAASGGDDDDDDE
jgi:hypothetical protein